MSSKQQKDLTDFQQFNSLNMKLSRSKQQYVSIKKTEIKKEDRNLVVCFKNISPDDLMIYPNYSNEDFTVDFSDSKIYREAIVVKKC